MLTSVPCVHEYVIVRFAREFKICLQMRRTALHYASKQGNIVIVEELLKAGSDVTAQDEVYVSEL